MWRLARATATLDLNSPYSYLLVCRDFANTSTVAEASDGGVVGFAVGYRRPTNPESLFVWQIAVAETHRGRGLAGSMLDELVTRNTARWLDATVTPGNATSALLFRSFARRWRASVDEETFISRHDFPPEAGEHDPEILYRIGPLE